MSSRRPAVRPLVAAAGIMGVACCLPACGGGTSVHTPGGARPALYRIVYRVERPATAAAQATFEEVIVRRPFTSRVAEFASDPGPSVAPAATPPRAPQSATVT